MKVKTNLSPSELKKVGMGLQKLADAQQGEIVLENEAERKLISRAENAFDLAFANLEREMSRILEKEE